LDETTELVILTVGEKHFEVAKQDKKFIEFID
jgi:hypothetical protein